MDQDATWYGGRPHPMRHCVRWGPTSPSPKGAVSKFLVIVRCGQMAGWTKMPLGMEAGLSPGDFVFDGDPAPSPQIKGHSPHPIFGACLLWQKGWMDQDATWYGSKHRHRRRCVRWSCSSPLLKGVQPQFLVHVYCGQTAGWIKTPLGMEVDLSPGHFVLDGSPAIGKRGTAAPSFRPMPIVATVAHLSYC